MEKEKLVKRIYEFAGEAFESYRGDRKYLEYLELNAEKVLLKSEEHYSRFSAGGYQGLNLELDCAGEFYALRVIETGFEYALSLLAENKTKECVEKLEDLIVAKPYYDVLQAYATALSNLSGVNSFKLVKPYYFMSLVSLIKRMDSSGLNIPSFGLQALIPEVIQVMFYSAGLFLKRSKGDIDAKNLLETDVYSYEKMITEDSDDDTIVEFLTEENFKNNMVHIVDLNEKREKVRSQFKEYVQGIREDRKMFSEQIVFFKILDCRGEDISSAKQKRRFVKALKAVLFTKKHKSIYDKSESLGPLDYRKIKEDMRIERIVRE